MDDQDPFGVEIPVDKTPSRAEAKPRERTPRPYKRKGRPYKLRHLTEADAGLVSTPIGSGDPILATPLTEENSGSTVTDGDLVDIWERRLLNPQGTAAPKIRITRPGMHLRWVNLNTTGRYQRARYDQGYVPVTKNLLVDEREVYGVGYTKEEYVVRGERQREMLMMIPEAIYRQIQTRKGEMTKKTNQVIKEQLRQAGATHASDKYGGSAGDQAADAIGTFKGNIQFGTERVSSDE